MHQSAVVLISANVLSLEMLILSVTAVSPPGKTPGQLLISVCLLFCGSVCCGSGAVQRKGDFIFSTCW